MRQVTGDTTVRKIELVEAIRRYEATHKGWTTAQTREALLMLDESERLACRSMWLFGNRITEVPLEIFTCYPNLEILSLHDNDIRAFPCALTKLTQLHSLSIHTNPYDQLPSCYTKLTRLQYLWTTSTQLPKRLQLNISNNFTDTQNLLKNISMHSHNHNQAIRSAALCLMGLKKYRRTEQFRVIDKGVVRMIAQMVWETRDDERWPRPCNDPWPGNSAPPHTPPMAERVEVLDDSPVTKKCTLN